MNTTKQVKQLLTTNPEMRDNPKKLLRRALQDIYGVNILSAIIIAEHYKQMERILRSNRKIQSDNKDLRGEKWQMRKEILAPKVRKELGYK
jgi:cell division protein FtsB